MIQSIDCEGVDTGLRYPGLADFLSEQEVGVLGDNLEEDTDAWLHVSTALGTKQLRLAEESDAECGDGRRGQYWRCSR
jgi:hypothetical protein